MIREKFKWRTHKSESTDAEHRADCLVVAMKDSNMSGARGGVDYSAGFRGQPVNGRNP